MTPPRHLWTPAQIANLRALVDEGYSYDDIAARLGRTRGAVAMQCKRLRAGMRHTRAQLSAWEASRLLGMRNSYQVNLWIQRGWLAARKGATNHWRIGWRDLITFIETRDNWMSYDPARIQDKALRAHLAQLQARSGGRWLTTAAVAHRYHAALNSVEHWIRRGYLPAIFRRRAYWVWSGDLEGWVPPYEQPRARGARQNGTSAL